MIISGQHFRSLAERKEISFSAEMSLNNIAGTAEIGFSGESSSFSFNFKNGRMIDPEGRYFNSYSKDEFFILSGNLETNAYDYYIDDKLNCSEGVKNNFNINSFYINTSGCEVDLDFNVYSAPQDYSIKYADSYIINDSLLGNVYNNQAEEFKIFTGTFSNSNFKLDLDVPSGSYDGTYIQDYKYYAGSGDLDECNGRFGVTPEYPSGVYHYHVTDDWPYVMSCFRGVPTSQINLITENTSGSTSSEIPSPWTTDKFFDRQTLVPQSDNVRHYLSGVGVEYSDKYVYIKSNGLPQHFYGPFSGQPLTQVPRPQKHLFRVPLTPESGKIPTAIPMGKVGVAINGVPIDLLSDEYYKQRGRWRLAVHPNQFGLDKYNAHVQPGGVYHYHAGFSGIVDDYSFTTPTISVGDIPNQYQVFNWAGFSKHASAFGVNVFATSGVKDSQVLHVANVLAEVIDNDKDGTPDNVNVVNSLVGNQASIIMGSGAISSNMSFRDEGVSGVLLDDLKGTGYYALQELKGIDTTGTLDKTLDTVVKLFVDYGVSEAYPNTFGLLSGSSLTNYMDSGRKGHHEWCSTHSMYDGTIMYGPIHGENQTCLTWGSIHSPFTFTNGPVNSRYPSGAWYHNTDYAQCDSYDCQASRYMYLGLSSLMGKNTGQYSNEWSLTGAEGLKTGDPNFYNLLIDPLYKLPTGYLPTGLYAPSSTQTTHGNTGHSPLIGYAFDGYPIYGPMGYSNALVSGEIKEMKSSYLTKGVTREAAYPKTIKQYNDLYLPYGIDLINAGNSLDNQLSVEVTLHTNFGDINKTLTAKGETELNNQIKNLGYQ